MQQWEYFRKKDLSDFELAELGNKGWELVAATPCTGVLYIFKRPKNIPQSNNSTSQSSQTTPEKEWSMQDLFPGIQITR